MSFWRRWLLRKKLKRNEIKIPGKTLDKKHAYTLEESLTLGHVNFVGNHSHNFAMGAHSYWRSGSCIGSVSIGRFCSISTEVIIGLEKNGHPLNWLSTSPFQYSRNSITRYRTKAMLDYQPEMSTTSIGHDVWVGNRVIIYNGCSLGVGAVVAAGSIVTKAVPAYAIVAGVPAKVIGYRFCEEVISQLVASEWWNLPVSMLADIDFDESEKFLQSLTEINLQGSDYRHVSFQNLRMT
ncbi:CatB-related O-acetyltransferase [Endozoicomonas acroporae]|uniref:CatB-related O-acetyltransferase n=1 Tax=Endozoicomonas acroporae TaxID=1701104 RepID=UPI000C76AFD4|nr:CatB-related O-acetyltransferase [Endozoicomonas acroporae]